MLQNGSTGDIFVMCVFWKSSAACSTQGAKFNLEQNKFFFLNLHENS